MRAREAQNAREGAQNACRTAEERAREAAERAEAAEGEARALQKRVAELETALEVCGCVGVCSATSLLRSVEQHRCWCCRWR